MPTANHNKGGGRLARLPSHRRGGAGGGVILQDRSLEITPTPNPSPQGGGGFTVQTPTEVAPIERVSRVVSTCEREVYGR